MQRSHLSYAFLLSFITTVFFLQWAIPWTHSPIFWGVVGLSILGGISVWVVSRRAIFLLLMATVAGLLLGSLSVWRITRPLPPSHVVHEATKQRVSLIGDIEDEPDRRGLATSYTVTALRLQTEEGSVVPVTGRVLLRNTKGWRRFAYGDRVVARGNLRRPWAMEDFRYDEYLRLRGIEAVMTDVSVERVDGGHGNPMFDVLFSLKDRFEEQIGRIFPEPHASFLAGLLTGSRGAIPSHVNAAFKTVGITHILAISGYNITIILSLLSGLLFWLPLRQRFLPCVFVLVAFTLFTGASASVVRAAIMGGLGLLALQTGRVANTRLLILWTAFFMLLWQPRSLWTDASFQLSFLAVIGISETNALMQRLLRFLPDILGIRESFQTTLAAQFFTLPWIMYLFGRVSLISPVANLLVAPLIPAAMLLGFLGIMLSFLSFPLGQLLSYGAWGVLELILRIADLLARVPYASVNMESGTVGVTILYAALVSLLVLHKHRFQAHLEANK